MAVIPGGLLRKQYQDGSNLEARIRLHTRFSTNRYGMFRWIFDQFAIPERARVLELGTGTGRLWSTNARRIPSGWRITVSDFSFGMLAEARAAVAKIAHPFAAMQIDAQALPFADRSFDAVIANHMLYHVPDIPRALREIRRVLAADGKCYAATLSLNNLRELDEMVQRFIGPRLYRAAERFGLENGGDLMRASFANVNLLRYPDSLEVTEAQPVMDYINSTIRHANASDEGKAALRQHLEAELATHGKIHMSKDSGLFIAAL
jgi:SAM-dependent methyltransferase